MQNEIEVKIMLETANVPFIESWLNQQNIIEKSEETLGNTYFDTPDRFFAHAKMGLRVRSQNQKHEMTLKMKGDIVGGLHIRPEYHVDLPSSQPDFKRLISTHHLQIENSEYLATHLHPTFSTDFVRQKWLVQFEGSEIEVALDQGSVKNPYGEEAICEIEFELKQGTLSTLLNVVFTMPKKDGMWLSSLSKAQRGYWVGQQEKIEQEINNLLACELDEINAMGVYRYTQQLADFLRMAPNNTRLNDAFLLFHPQLKGSVQSYLKSAEYLEVSLIEMQAWFAQV